MTVYIAHPKDAAQERAVKAFLGALKVPYKESDETAYLLSTESNKRILLNAVKNESKGKGTKITLDKIWK